MTASWLDVFDQATILVVGGAGFVGSNLVKTLLQQPCHKIVVVDNLLSSESENLPLDSRLNLLQGSINQDEILVELRDEYDYVFHLATYHGNQSSIHDPLADHENNTLTSLKLFDRFREYKRLKKLVYASAGCVVAPKTFDTAKATSEETPVSLYLDSPYQISKLVGEMYANYYFRRYNMPAVKARFQNVYGPGEILGAGQWRGTPATVWRNVIPTFVYRGLKSMPLTVENGGIATRDFIYVDDIVSGLMRCASQGQAGDVYNLASGVETSILELAQLINELTANPVELDYTPAREWDRSGKRFGETSKANAELDFEAVTELREGLQKTITWTQEHLPLIERCIARHAEYMA